MLISPLQILREKVAKNIKELFDVVKARLNWLKYFLNIFKKG